MAENNELSSIYNAVSIDPASIEVFRNSLEGKNYCGFPYHYPQDTMRLIEALSGSKQDHHRKLAMQAFCTPKFIYYLVNNKQIPANSDRRTHWDGLKLKRIYAQKIWAIAQAQEPHIREEILSTPNAILGLSGSGNEQEMLNDIKEAAPDAQFKILCTEGAIRGFPGTHKVELFDILKKMTVKKQCDILLADTNAASLFHADPKRFMAFFSRFSKSAQANILTAKTLVNQMSWKLPVEKTDDSPKVRWIDQHPLETIKLIAQYPVANQVKILQQPSALDNFQYSTLACAQLLTLMKKMSSKQQADIFEENIESFMTATKTTVRKVWTRIRNLDPEDQKRLLAKGDTAKHFIIAGIDAGEVERLKTNWVAKPPEPAPAPEPGSP